MNKSLRVLVGCEHSGMVRRAFRALGHDAWSCDILPAEDGSEFHLQCDVRDVLGRRWDLAIFHTPCTRLTNAGVRWLKVPPPNRTLVDVWQEFFRDAELYRASRAAPIPRIAMENPVMHKHAKEFLQCGNRQVVQPWMFGEPQFKAVGLELIGLPPLVPTDRLTPPKPGTEEHKAWSKVHRMAPGPDRQKERSRFFPGIATAMAHQWAGIATEVREAA